MSSTGSSFERRAGAIARRVSRAHEERELSRAQAAARRAVDDATPTAQGSQARHQGRRRDSRRHALL